MPLPYVYIPDGHLGPIPIHPFGVLVATGVLVGSSLAVKRGERYGIPRQKFESFIGWILVFGFVLSHMLDEVMYRPHDVIDHPLQLLKIWAGISSYGGFIGAIVGAFLYKYVDHDRAREPARRGIWGSVLGMLHAVAFRRAKTPEKILPYLDNVAAVFPIAWIFGRSGCSVAHDHIGRASTSFLAVNFPGGPRFDLGLLEMLCTIPIAIVTLWFARKPRRPGQIVGFLALLYAPVRFVLDALRATDVPGADARYFGLTPGQWLSIALVALGVGMLLQARGKPPLEPKPVTAPPPSGDAPVASKS